MPGTPLLDSNSNCIFTFPGECILYTGLHYPCGNLVSGISFNETVLRLVRCISQITTTTSSTTSTTTTTLSTSSTTSTSTTTLSTSSTTSTSTTSTSTTSTSTSSTTSTSTTHTTTTTTTTTTSSTTTTTTTLPSAMIYWGAQSSGTPPNSTQVQAQLSGNQNPTGIVNVSWVSFNGSPQYCWAAVPTSYPKTKWFDTGSNNGNIGGGGDLFATFGTVTIGVTIYTVYMTQYQTQFAEATQLQP